jgi:hypothetical protein
MEDTPNMLGIALDMDRRVCCAQSPRYPHQANAKDPTLYANVKAGVVWNPTVVLLASPPTCLVWKVAPGFTTGYFF